MYVGVYSNSKRPNGRRKRQLFDIVTECILDSRIPIGPDKYLLHLSGRNGWDHDRFIRGEESNYFLLHHGDLWRFQGHVSCVVSW